MQLNPLKIGKAFGSGIKRKNPAATAPFIALLS
jgi:hypothetical protein